jgi:hypothetical protein
MIFDELTLNVLKNFSTINPSIRVLPGNIITTVNKGETVFARAKVPNEFEKEFAILDLSRFLAALSIITKPEVEFVDTHILIKNSTGSNKIYYTLTSPNAVLSKPDSKVSIKQIDVSFQFTLEMYSQLTKAISVLQSNEVTFCEENGKLVVKAQSSSNPSENVYSVEICELDNPLSKSYTIDVDNIALMPSDYTINLDTRGMVNFSKENLDYYVMIKSKSNKK